MVEATHPCRQLRSGIRSYPARDPGVLVSIALSNGKTLDLWFSGLVAG